MAATTLPSFLALTKCLTDALGGDERVLEDEPRLEPEHAVAEPPQEAVSAGVSLLAPRVRAAIDFHDQLGRGGDEVADIATAERHLPLESDAQFLAGKQAVQGRFRFCGRVAHGLCALFEKDLGFGIGLCLTHGTSQSRLAAGCSPQAKDP